MAAGRRARSGSGAFEIWWFEYAVLAILAVTTVVLVSLAYLHLHSQEDEAAAEAALYTPPPLRYDEFPVASVSVVGDSYTGGSDMNSGASALWWSRISADIPVQFDIHAVGGSGYTAKSPIDADQTTFVDRAADVDSHAKIVLFFGSRNDVASEEDVTTAATKAFAAAKKVAPEARLIVIGPPWTDSSPPSVIRSDRDAIEHAAKGAGAVWVDPLSGNWFPTGSGLIGSDGVHPTDAGHARLATLIEPIIEKYL